MTSDLDELDKVPVVDDRAAADVEIVAVSPLVRRGVLVGLGIIGTVLAATLIGAVLSSDSDGDPELTDEPTLLVTSTTTEALSSSTTALDQVSTSTAPAPTTTAVPVEPAQVFADNPSNTSLVLWNYNVQRVLVIDVDASETIELDMTDFGVPLVERIIASTDRLVVQSLGDYYVVEPAGQRTRLDTRGVVQAFGDDEVWVTEAFIGDQPSTPFRIDFTGERTELPEVPGDIFPFAWFGDRLLVGGGQTGGVYIESGDGYERIAEGQLLAGRNGFMLTRVCDDVLRCTVHRTDLESGAVTTHIAPSGFSLTALWWLDDPTSPNLDAVLGVSEDLGSPALWDLTTDEVTPLGIGQGRGATFSPDGTWVFVSVSNDILAYHRASGSEVVVPIAGGVDAPNGLQLAALPVG